MCAEHWEIVCLIWSESMSHQCDTRKGKAITNKYAVRIQSLEIQTLLLDRRLKLWHFWYSCQLDELGKSRYVYNLFFLENYRFVNSSSSIYIQNFWQIYNYTDMFIGIQLYL